MGLIGLLVIAAHGGGGQLFYDRLTGVGFAYLLFLIVGFFVARDAPRVGANPLLWGLATSLIPVVGLLVYALRRVLIGGRQIGRA